jgi:ATP-dependent RNA helicase DDX56/DBP9
MKLRTTAIQPSEVVSGRDDREEEEKVDETMAPTFASLLSEVDLDVRLRKAVARLGYIHPTLVQTQCIRLAINSGRDLLVRARTGSGKTLAYCLPVLHKILLEHKDGSHPSTHHHARGRSVDGDDGSGSSSIKAVILVPTRELCEQVHSVLQSLIYYCDEVISIAVLGATISKGSSGNKSTISSSTKSNRSFLVAQEAMLRDNPNVIVATPAALLRYIGPTNTTTSLSNSSSSTITVSLKNVSSLVIDEADLVLSFGYSLQQDILQIIKALPNIYQGYLMSATLTPDIQALKKVVLHSPAILKLEEGDDDPKHTKGGKKLAQFYLSIPKNDKELVLYVFLKVRHILQRTVFLLHLCFLHYMPILLDIQYDIFLVSPICLLSFTAWYFERERAILC